MVDLHQKALDTVSKEKKDFADLIASVIQTKQFIVCMTSVIVVWIVFNVLAVMLQFDPYPFVFLNLMLGFMAAYTGPFVMMSQSKQEEKDRKLVEYDVEINKKTEMTMEDTLAEIRTLKVSILDLHAELRDMQQRKRHV